MSNIPRIGTAGWAVPTSYKALFPSEGTHLQKYAQVFNCVEINSCFYREHKSQTYEKWANSTPDDFLFSLKLLKYFTHEKKLTDTGPDFKKILNGHQSLGKKWGSLLIQLPPSLNFEKSVANKFFSELRNIYEGLLFCEPRHQTWLSDAAFLLFEKFSISKVIADPEPCPTPKMPKNLYLRLHGSPQIYKSSYTDEFLKKVAAKIKTSETQSWCIFDNTTFGYSIENAVKLKTLLNVQVQPLLLHI